MATKKKTGTSIPDRTPTLRDAILDVTSDAWQPLLAAASPSQVDELLEGVTWAVPRAYAPGALVPNAAFTGRGKKRAPLMKRLLDVVTCAPASPGLNALRGTIRSLQIESGADETIDLGGLRTLTALEWLVVHDVKSVRGLEAVAHVPKVHLRLREADVAPLVGVKELSVGSYFSADAVLTVTGASTLTCDVLSIVRADPPCTTFAARDVNILPVRTSLGPITGPNLRSLSVYNAGREFKELHLGALPALTTLRATGLPSLVELSGAEHCPLLVDAAFTGTSLASVPQLPPGLESLMLEGADLDLGALDHARLPALRRLRLRSTGRFARIDAIASLTDLEELALPPPADLGEVMSLLLKLRRLKHLSLAGHVLERVPSALADCPSLEVVSLVGCRGFLEHDVLCHMPALREVRLNRSTLAQNKTQLEPRLRKNGVKIDWETAF